MLKKLDSVEKYLGGILFLIIIILGFLQVAFRYILKSPLAWTEELTLFLFVWFVYLGSSACTRENRHVRVEMFVENLPPKMQQAVNLFTNICWIIFCIIIFITSYKVAALSGSRHSATIAAKLPYVIAMSAVPVGMVLMGLRVIQNTIELLHKKSEPENVEGGKR